MRIVEYDLDSCELTDKIGCKPSSESGEDNKNTIDGRDNIMEELKELGLCRNSLTESILGIFNKWLQGIHEGRRDM